jgi:hypothetical protein
MSDRIARIFIDSNFRRNIQDDHGNFTVDLPLSVLVEAGSHIRVEGLVIAHVWSTIDSRNNHLFIREVEDGVSYHRLISLTPGNYNISTLAVALQAKLRQGSFIDDGLWTVTSSDEGLLTLRQSSPTFDSAVLYSASDIAGFTADFSQSWADANVTTPLRLGGGDAAALVGIPVQRMTFNQAERERLTGHVDLARYRVLHLCSPDLPQTSLSPHGRSDVVSTLIIAGNAPGSLIHNGFATPPSLYCANSRQLHHLSFSVRDSNDRLVHLPHSIHFEIVISRPYE